MARTMVSNMIEGVTNGYSKSLELRGVGYRAQMKGNDLSMQLGYSHDINYTPPAGIKIEAPKPTSVIVSGINKQQVRSGRRRKSAPSASPSPTRARVCAMSARYVRQKEGKKK